MPEEDDNELVDHEEEDVVLESDGGEETDLATLGIAVGPVLELLKSLLHKTAEATRVAAAAVEQNKVQQREIAALKLAAAGGSSSVQHVPLHPDNDYYTPGRSGVPDPSCPRLLPFSTNDPVLRAIFGKDADFTSPSGKVLEWTTIQSVPSRFHRLLGHRNRPGPGISKS